MTTSSDENREPDTSADERPSGISDEQLPEDLRPGDDNPLAQDPDDQEESGADTTDAAAADEKPPGG